MADSIKTIGSGQDYSDVENWINLWLKTGSAFAGDDEIGQVSGEVVDTPGLRIEFDTGKTSAAQRIVLTSKDNRHEGVWDNTKDMSRSSANYCGLRDPYMTIEDLQVGLDVAAGNRGILTWVGGNVTGEVIIRRCIVNVLSNVNNNGFVTSTAGANLAFKLYRNNFIGKAVLLSA